MRSQDEATGRGGRGGLLTPRPDVSRAEFTLDFPSFQQVFVEPALCEVERIRDALDRANFDDAAVRSLARLQLGLEVPPELLVEVLTCLEVTHLGTFIALARQVPTEILVDRLRHGHFGDDSQDLDRTALVASVAWLSRPTDETRAQLLPRLRRAARWPRIPLEACVLLGGLVVQLDDPHLREIFETRHGTADTPLVRQIGDQVRQVWNLPLKQLIASLPQETNDPFMRAWAVSSPPRQVGRNELCPCGSGKKFKRCHVDSPEEIRAPQPPRTEMLNAFSSWVEPELIRRMPRDLRAALDVRRLKTSTLGIVLRAHTYARDWKRARQARDELARRLGKSETDPHWFPVVYEAIRAGQYDVARELFSELSDPSVAKDLELELELHDLCELHRDAFDRLERAAETAVRRGTMISGVLSRALLHKLPALGILVTRGAHPDICDADPDELTGLLYEVEDARDELGIAPNDPAWGIYGLSDDTDEDGQQAPEPDEREREGLAKLSAELQGKLDQTTQRLRELERQLAEQARAAAVERPATPAVSAPTPPDAEQRARQKQRIEELEALVREKNQELSEVRRAQAELTRRSASPAAPAGNRHDDAEAQEESFDAVVEPAGGRRVLVPVFNAIAETALGEVPREVAAAAVVAVGRLAAGEAGAWRRIKQAKDMPQQVLMARIGIHHRLLFRADQGRLEVLDLVTRESLMTTLKRLRVT